MQNGSVTNNFTTIIGEALAADPTAEVILTPVDGTALTFMRSDAAPPLSQEIEPTMTGAWIWQPSAATKSPVIVRAHASQSVDILRVTNAAATEHYIRSVIGNTGFGFTSSMSAPAATVHTVADQATGLGGPFLADGYGSSVAAFVAMRRALGTRNAPLRVSGSNFTLSGLLAQGAFAASDVAAASFPSGGPTGSMEFFSRGAFTSGSQPTAFQIHTTPSSSISRVPVLTISEAGFVGIGLDGTTPGPYGTMASNRLHVVDSGLFQVAVAPNVGTSTFLALGVNTSGRILMGSGGSANCFVFESQAGSISSPYVSIYSTGSQLRVGSSTSAYTQVSYGGSTTLSYTLPATNALSTTSVLRNTIPVAGASTLSWGQLVLTTDVTGILPITNGGTGISTTPVRGDLLTGNSTPAWQTVGYRILHDTNTGAFANLFIGKNAGNFTTTGGQQGNYAFGEIALTALTNGEGNFAAGYRSLRGVTTGDYNFGMGEDAGFQIVTGSYNVCFGPLSGPDADRTNTIAIGYGATVDADKKVVIGNTDAEVAGAGSGTTVVELRGDLRIRDASTSFLSIFSTAPSADRTYTLQNASGTLAFLSDITGMVTGSGTTNALPRWTSSSVLGDSGVSDDGVTVSTSLAVSLDGTNTFQAEQATPITLTNAGSGRTRIYASSSTFAIEKAVVPSVGIAFFAGYNLQVLRTSGQDAIGLSGRSGGSSSWVGSITPAALSADHTYTMPDFTGNVAVIAGSLVVASGKTFTVNNTLTLAGTDSTTMTFPTTTATIARTDAAQAFTGVQTFNDGIKIGETLDTEGRIDSAVGDANNSIQLLYKPSVAMTSSGTRYIHSFQDSGGNVGLTMKSDLTWEYGGNNTGGGYINVGLTVPTSVNFGINFNPLFAASGGASIGGIATAVAGGAFVVRDGATTTATSVVGGAFVNSVVAGRAHTNLIGGLFNPAQTITAAAVAHGNIYGWYVRGIGTAMSSTATAIYGGFVQAMLTGVTPATTDAYGLFIEEQVQATNKYGLWLGGTTAGYKAIAIGSTTNFIAPESSTAMSLNTTSLTLKATNIGLYTAAAVAQATTAGAASTFAAVGAGTGNVTDVSTFDGYTVAQVVKALRNIGVLA